MPTQTAQLETAPGAALRDKIVVRNLDFYYNNSGPKALKSVSLPLKLGKVTAFIGPSGCGKSTLLRMIAGLDGVTAGDIRIGGRRVNDLEPAARKIAMVFQSYALYPHMSVAKNMTFGLKFSGMAKDEIERRVSEAARMLRLEELLDRRPRDLSGGQRQRVAIGRAIVREPDVFLFDEPLSNLDAALRVSTRVEIAKLHRLLKATMIYVTHDQIEAMTLADRIVVLNAGRIEQVGSPLDLYENPQSLFVAGFIGSPKMNLLDGVHATAFGCETVGVRPEHLDIVESGGQWTGKVIHTEKLGADSYLYLDVGMEEPMTVREDGTTKFNTGDTVSVRAETGKIHRFGKDGKPVASV